MPALTNTSHEVFAQELAKGSSKAAAYAAAGYEPDRSNAAKLTTKHHVQRRIAEIQAGGVELAQMTVASLVAAAVEKPGDALPVLGTVAVVPFQAWAKHRTSGGL